MLADLIPQQPNERWQEKDPDLEHQLDLVWASASKREVRATCNCGWFGLVRRPEVLGAIQASFAEYEGHLVADGRRE